MNKTQCKYNNRNIITIGIEKSSEPIVKMWRFLYYFKPVKSLKINYERLGIKLCFAEFNTKFGKHIACHCIEIVFRFPVPFIACA